MNLQVWCLDYHENISLPIKRDINATRIKRNIMERGVVETEQAINPKTLQQFIESQVIEKVMKGQELDAVLRFLKIMIILAVVIGVIHFGLFLQASGILENLKI